MDIEKADQWSTWSTRKRYNALIWIIGTTLSAVIVFLGERVINADGYCNQRREQDAAFYEGTISELKKDCREKDQALTDERHSHMARLEKIEAAYLDLRKESDSLKDRKR